MICSISGLSKKEQVEVRYCFRWTDLLLRALYYEYRFCASHDRKTRTSGSLSGGMVSGEVE